MNKTFEELVKESIIKTIQEKFPKKSAEPKKDSKPTLVEKVVNTAKTIAESVVLLPKVWILKTEKLSSKTKEAHYQLYKEHLNAANKVSIRLDAVNKEVSDSDHSAFRSLKADETENKNSAMLHELYFSNISSLNSEVHADSLSYMRLARDWGSFDNWQFDFIACCMASREGWAVCYLDPYKNKYMNCVIDGDTVNVPLGCIPIIVMDMHSHSYYYDYVSEKRAYVNAMMQEINWDIIEARIIVAEKANLHNLFAIMPIQQTEAEKLVPNLPQNQPPIGKDQVITPNNDQDKSTTPNKDMV